MENRYRPRNEDRNIVSRLEKMLPFWERLWSRMTLRRILSSLKRWLLVTVLAAAALVGLFFVVYYAIDKAASLSIDKINIQSRHGMIDRDEILKLLGLKGAVNLATLNAHGMEKRLEACPAIESATVRAELPDTLVIEVAERIPIVYVAMETDVDTGVSRELFMDPEGHVFPADPNTYADFLGVPVWYLPPGSCDKLEPGTVLSPELIAPICDIIRASNLYDPATEIPPIREIFRPKDWEIRLILEGGTEVRMAVYDVTSQMARLAMVLEHARRTKRHISSANVIPEQNPAVIFLDSRHPAAQPAPSEAEEESPSRRNRH
ncbi:MAG TPA: FtsQ-type POTRA domain-containing protein [Candidatus Akkermansia intestinavium]|nr:FtsQ-type POTRA domain-containing protein [Candidatus Akkermansia intestinavium]